MEKDTSDKKNAWTAPAIVLAGGLVALAVFNVNVKVEPEERREPVVAAGRARLASVDSVKMHGDFVCACCGKSIAECKCGMAEERRAAVDALVARGLSKREVYKEMVKKYTEEILFNTALAAEIKQELADEAPAVRSIISVEPKSVEAGVVSMAKGEVEAVYKVRNAGKAVLEIFGLETSCMCTTAWLRNKKEKSPVFGMHDNPTGWSMELGVGEEAELVVKFDPNAHGPEAVGPVTRTITIFSDDMIDAAKKVQFEAEVVK